MLRLLLCLLFSALYFYTAAQEVDTIQLNRISKKQMRELLQQKEYGAWRAPYDTAMLAYVDTIYFSKPDDGSFSRPSDCIMQEWEISGRNMSINHPTWADSYVRDTLLFRRCSYMGIYDMGNPYRIKLIKKQDEFFIRLKGKKGIVREYSIVSLTKSCCEFPQSFLTVALVRETIPERLLRETAAIP